MNPKLINNIIIIILVLGLGVAVYIFFFSDKSSGTPSLVSSSGELAGSISGFSSAPNRQFLATLNNLETIKLDVSIFSNPAFLGFRDYSLPLDPEPSGRENPFKSYNPNAIWIADNDSVDPNVNNNASSTLPNQ